MPSAIFYCNAVAACGVNSHNCVTKVKKQVEVKFSFLQFLANILGLPCIKLHNTSVV